MFSLPKILGLLAILWLVWMLFKIIERRQIQTNSDKNGTADNQRVEGADKAVEVEECPHCNKFVSKGGCARKTVRFLVDFLVFSG